MSEHTPGPWRYQEGADRYTHIVRADGNRFVYQGAQNDEGRANAHLIAAAPDLYAVALRLEVAEIASANCAACEAASHPCGPCAELFDQARNLRRLALEKARGRERTACVESNRVASRVESQPTTES